MDALGQRVIHFADYFLRQSPAPFCKFLGGLIPPLPGCLQFYKMILVSVNISKPVSKHT